MSGTGDEGLVAPGVVTERVDDTAQLVSEPVDHIGVLEGELCLLTRRTM